MTHDRAQSGFGVHAIPFTALDAYARRLGLDAGEFETFAQLVRAADEEFVAVMAERLKREARKGG